MRTIVLFCFITAAVATIASCGRSPEPALDLKASPASIDAGDSITLSWGSQNADSVRIEPGIGEVGEAGNVSVSPTSSVTYTATATGPGGTATAIVEVTVHTPSVTDLFDSTMQPVYFDLDRADIRSDQAVELQTAARFLTENAEVQLTIEGHADERGSQKYNMGIGERRANAVRTYLTNQGVAATRIDVVSFGEDHPVCTQSNEGCWSRNRRVEYALRQPAGGIASR